MAEHGNTVDIKISLETGESSHCNVCGSFLVTVRGKHPGDEKRKTCPTCTLEKLEQIREISDSNYGKAYQSI